MEHYLLNANILQLKEPETGFNGDTESIVKI